MRFQLIIHFHRFIPWLLTCWNCRFLKWLDSGCLPSSCKPLCNCFSWCALDFNPQFWNESCKPSCACLWSWNSFLGSLPSEDRQNIPCNLFIWRVSNWVPKLSEGFRRYELLTLLCIIIRVDIIMRVNVLWLVGPWGGIDSLITFYSKINCS